MTSASSARARAWRAPRRLRVTSIGKTYLILTVGVGLGALNTGNNLLYLVLGFQLATIVVSGILSERCLRELRVTRGRVEGLRALEMGHLAYQVEAGGSPAFALRFSEESHPSLGHGHLAFLAPGEHATVRANVNVPRRGPLRLTGVSVTTLYPLGLFAKSRTFDLTETIWVYPRRCAAPPGLPPSSNIRGEAQGSPRPGGGGDLLGLKELRATEDARRIHWLKSAAAGRPLQAEREQEQERTIELTLPDAPLRDALDGPCEATAALAQRYLEEGFHVGVTTREGRVAPGAGGAQAHRILSLLARAGFPKEAA